ncbi:MAG: hypothetical protein AAF092_14285 [Pseudomonadota bacterium]
MSALTVQAGEAGRIRVFALSMTEAEAKALAANPSPEGGPSYQEEMLGATKLDHAYVEVVSLKSLEGVGLVDYLIEGHGAEPADVAQDKAKLGALGGSVMVVMSPAFQRQAMQLSPDPRLTLIGIYAQEGVDWAPAPVSASSAAPYSAEARPKKPMSDARISGMVATAVLAFLALFVVIFVWIGG